VHKNLQFSDRQLLKYGKWYSIVVRPPVLAGRWYSIVVRPPVLAGELSLSSTRLKMASHMTTLWVKHPLLVNQHGQLSQPSLWGPLNE